MSDSLHSASWYRVENLVPRLRSHAQIHRHEYRSKIWYLLQDHSAGRTHRFTPAAYAFIGLMNGSRTVNEIWLLVTEKLGDKAPSQDEIIRMLAQLHAADALVCDVTPDSSELFRRFERMERMKIRQKLWTPLAIRIPLFDPERFLTGTLPLARLLFNRYTGILWVMLVVTGIVLAGMNWGPLTRDVVDRVLTPGNLFLIWLIYPVVKAVHELSHAWIARLYGGEVHEIGIMLLVFVPVPYVDVSSIWGLHDKWRRALVGAAGIAAELLMGSIALIVWLNVEPGTISAICYNILLISGVSTLLFNGNPLLRFDGYYVLSDVIEIPNLGARANRYLGYLFQKTVLGMKTARTTVVEGGEKVWLAGYGIAAFIYRMFIMYAIILYVGGKFFTIGVILAIWATISQILIPVSKNMKFLFSSPATRNVRGRASFSVAAILLALVSLLFIVPAPSWTMVEGVTWPSEQSQVRAGTDGFITEFLVGEQSVVEVGQPLVRLQDPYIDSRVQVLSSRLAQLQAQYAAARVEDRVQADLVEQEMTVVQGDLDRAIERQRDLVILSPRAGTFVIPREQDLAGRFVSQGQLVAYVTDARDHSTVRAVVTQDDIGLVRDRTRKVDVRVAAWHSESYQAELSRIIPGGTDQLPTAALGSNGGGNIAVNPGDSSGTNSLQRVFELELLLPDEARTAYLGARVKVRIDHGFEPLGVQGLRALRQTFLRRFGV